MKWDCKEFVIRYTRLRDELKPVEIYMGDPPEPINPDWVAITHGQIWSARRPDGIEGFNLTFFMDDGRRITSEQFDTLNIAMDQAKSIVGILHDEWQSCHVEITNENGSISWSIVA
jgi:hypothetical protein